MVIGRTGMLFDGGRTPGLRTREMPLGNLVADAMLAAASRSDSAVAAIVNGGGIRAGLNAGDATFEDALAVLPFGNTVAVLDLKGEELVAALDHGVSRPGRGCFPAGGWPEAGLLRVRALPGGVAAGGPGHGAGGKRRPGGFGRHAIGSPSTATWRAAAMATRF
jgi:hypothetical protein